MSDRTLLLAIVGHAALDATQHYREQGNEQSARRFLITAGIARYAHVQEIARVYEHVSPQLTQQDADRHAGGRPRKEHRP